MPEYDLDHLLHLSVSLSRDTVQSLTHEDHIHPDEEAVSTLAALFITGIEMGMRLSINAGTARTKAFLKHLTDAASHPNQPPMEIRERMMKEDTDFILGVAILRDGRCPDCRSDEIVYDEANWHLVCAGCGQLVREPPE